MRCSADNDNSYYFLLFRLIALVSCWCLTESISHQDITVVAETLTTTVRRTLTVKSACGLVNRTKRYDTYQEIEEIQKKKALTKEITEEIFKAKAEVQLSNAEAEKTQQSLNSAVTALTETRNKVFAASVQLAKAQDEALSASQIAKRLQAKLATDHKRIFSAYQKLDSLTSLLIPLETDVSSVEQAHKLRESARRLDNNDDSQQQENLTGKGLPSSLPSLDFMKRDVKFINKTRKPL